MSSNVASQISESFANAQIISIITFFAFFLFIRFFMFFFGGASDLFMSRALDLVVFSVGILYFLLNYDSITNNTSEDIDKLQAFLQKPTSIFSTLIFIIVFYFSIYVCGVSMDTETKAISISIIENVAWLTVFILLIIDFIHYILKVSVSDFLNFDWLKTTDSSGNVIKDSSGNKVANVKNPINEVFNISNNLYSYDDAQAICRSYGADLATYDQVEQSYNNGGEWCNYGWSANQMILFPTQKSTWNKLQTTEKHKNDCGRPGINGGHIANPYAKFGVNCYGVKPKATKDDLSRMAANQNAYPESEADRLLNKKVQYWKDHSAEMLVVNPFNKKSWND